MHHIQVAQCRIHRSVREVVMEHFCDPLKDCLVGAGIGHRKVWALWHRVPRGWEVVERWIYISTLYSYRLEIRICICTHYCTKFQKKSLKNFCLMDSLKYSYSHLLYGIIRDFSFLWVPKCAQITKLSHNFYNFEKWQQICDFSFDLWKFFEFCAFTLKNQKSLTVPHNTHL